MAFSKRNKENLYVPDKALTDQRRKYTGAYFGDPVNPLDFFQQQHGEEVVIGTWIYSNSSSHCCDRILDKNS